jgi:hypothetical protein
MEFYLVQLIECGADLQTRNCDDVDIGASPGSKRQRAAQSTGERDLVAEDTPTDGEPAPEDENAIAIYTGSVRLRRITGAG